LFISGGHKNFQLAILCYCEPENVLSLEQHYIDSLKPEYNILQVAGSPLGHKHTEETLEKMSAPPSSEMGGQVYGNKLFRK